MRFLPVLDPAFLPVLGGALKLDPGTVPVIAAGLTGNPWADFFVSQGPMGVVAAVFAYIMYTLWNDNKALRKQIDDLQAARLVDASARLADANAARDQMLKLADNMHGTIDAFAKIADRLERARL